MIYLQTNWVWMSMHSSQMEARHQLYELFETAQVVCVYVDRDNQVYRGWQHEVYTNVCKLFVNIHNMFANAPTTFMKFHKVFFAKYRLYTIVCS